MATAEKATESTALVSMKERIAQRLANVNKATAAPASKNISTKGGKFTLPDGSASAGPLNCIVVDYINSNVFYDGPYDPNNVKPPVCAAIGRDINLMAPLETLETRVSDSCNGCPNNEFGSAGRGKACKNNVVLALIPEEFTEDTEVMTIKVSPTGLTTWSSYVRQLANQGIDVSEVVTSITFRAGVTYPTLDFKALNRNTKLDAMNAFIAQADTLLNSVNQ